MPLASSPTPRRISSRSHGPSANHPPERRRPRLTGALAHAVAAPLESLERRLLLAGLPAPLVGELIDVSGTTTNVDYNTPSIAHDPRNPRRLVTVFTRHAPGGGGGGAGTQLALVQGAFSLDGGASWSPLSMPANLLDPLTGAAYTRATDANVAFDHQGNFYVVYSQHDDAHSSGAIVLQKFSLAGTSPAHTITNKVLYQWAGRDAALAPALAVDGSLATYQDPQTQAIQHDPHVGTVYVAWATDNAGAANPNTIKLVASGDGGNTFSTQVHVNDGLNDGPTRNATPRMVVSQGTADGRVKPGQLSIIWDDFGGGAAAADRIMADRVTDGGRGALVTATGGPITDAASNVAQTTGFVATVNIADPSFLLSDLDVVLNLDHGALEELAITLVAPNGGMVQLVQSDTLGGRFLGVLNGFHLGTTFDSQAPRSISDPAGASPSYVGHFAPAGGSLTLFDGMAAAQLTGQWRLLITDYVTSDPQPGDPPPMLLDWSLRFTSNLTTGSDGQAAVTSVRGAIRGPFPLAPVVSPDRGIGPGASIASDNTLGSFSPYQGRLYVAYTESGGGGDNTDVALVTSDDGGVTWSVPVRVNDDNAILDGFSQSDRPQFQPSVAVDQSTGTLVVSYYDARHDAARARVATYLATSIDGGATFGAQTYVNESNTVIDTVTLRPVALGPVPDNQSSGNPDRDTEYAFGDRQGITVAQGRVHPVWSGNRNDGFLRIFTTTASIAAGPRIISSTMGPVSQPGDLVNPSAADGTPRAAGFEVLFDRPIDPASFTPADVQVRYRDGHTPGSAPGTLVAVSIVEPLDSGRFGPAGAVGATRFLVTFAAPQSAVGTYSYSIAPTVNDRIRHVGLATTPARTFTYHAMGTQVGLSVPPVGTGGAGDGRDVTTSTITIAGIPAEEILRDLNVRVNLAHTYLADLVLTLVAPGGTRIVLARQRGSAGQNYEDTLFDDQASAPIGTGAAPFTGSFRPEQSLGILSGRGVNGDWRLEIRDRAGTDVGTLVAWSLEISTGALSTVIAGGNALDQDADAEPGEAPLAGTTTGDLYAIPRPMQDGAFTGAFVTAPFSFDTLPLIVPGPHVVATRVDGQPASADNLVLNGGASSIDVTFDRDMDPSSFTAASLVRMAGPAGVIADARRYVSSDRGVAIPDIAATPLVSRLDVDDSFTIADVNVRLDVTHLRVSDLRVVLVAPDGRRISLINRVGLAGAANFNNTLLDDSAPASIADGAAPYAVASGYRPAAPLGVLNGRQARGVWTLEITDAAFLRAGTLNGWSLTFTPAAPSFAVTPNPHGNDPNPQFPRTYRFHFPTQTLSGTYTLRFAASIRSKDGDLLDSDLNAGLDQLRGTSDVTAPVSFGNGIEERLGDGAAPDKVTTSTINVTDSFVIQGTTLRLNISYPNDPDLEATLIAPDGTAIRLFNGVGGSGTRRDFTNTVFDDFATTPIQNGAAPFFGRFNPQQPLSVLRGKNSAGVWTLQIRSRAAGRTGTLRNWELTFAKPQPSAGLGDPVADQAAASFRIFTMDPADPTSHAAWTAVGPAPAGGNSGRIGGLAVDPSDPTGNTVYVAGASGGVWKTTNFLTSHPAGPTYVPLTDFGPTFAMNIGGLAVFPRNNDPDQTIVFAATGEGNTGSRGVGIIRSMDGGATWTLLDSTRNVDAQGNPLPMNSPQRDHVLVGSSAFKIVVDPRPTPAGEVIVYAALSGTNGGVWRSTDSGKSWTRMRGGNATDVVLDPNSGYVDAVSNPTGNLDVIYSAFRGEGVFISPNRGQVWNPLLGGVGKPLLRDADVGTSPPAIPVGAPSDIPNGGKGRITLAKPELTGNPSEDTQYQGWLYALVVTADSLLDGLYLTKDFGQNWTKIRLPSAGGVPTNDPAFDDYTIFGTTRPQGNYDVSFAIDPNNPNVVYIGGKRDGAGHRVLRVDTSGVADPHAFYRSTSRADGGAMATAINGPAAIKGGSTPVIPGNLGSPITNPYLNLQRDPGAPFLANATIFVTNTASFVNDGTGAKWIPFDEPQVGNDNQRIIAFRDPLTGKTRLIFGNDHTVSTGVDDGGVYVKSIGSVPVAFGNRTGNLQITQFYYGASQPSNLAAQIAGALFYGSAQDDGAPFSSPEILETGNLNWLGPNRGDSGGVATDQTGSGTVYQYDWPCCGGEDTNFFQVNGVGRTFGLLQAGDDPGNRLGQWPYQGTINFAVNPLNGEQIIISSNAGRIFGTTNQGVFWLEIGSPAALDGTQALALAYGAPDPDNNPTGALNNFLYAGTDGGRIFVTFDGGGANGNNWLNLSLGLDGSPVRAIVTNPLRGSREAFAVTAQGVYHMPDAAVPRARWTNVTGNLAAIRHHAFGDFSLTDTQARDLTSIQADWRYAIPDDPDDADGPSHPVLYVGGEGGVYRSLDKGASWHLFPDNAVDGASRPGGYLPNARVTDLDLAIGNVDPTTGRTTVANSPNVLMASTYGRGAFAIRLAPLVVPGTFGLTRASDSGVSDRDGLTNVLEPVFTGRSAQTAFGNNVRITLLDLTDPLNPVIIGGYDGTSATDVAENRTNGTGRFDVRVRPGVFSAGGSSRTIGVRATDDGGAVGPITTFTITFDTDAPAEPDAVSFTATEAAAFNGVVATVAGAGPFGTVTIDWGDGKSSPGTLAPNSSGGFDVLGSHTYANGGTFSVGVTIADAAGNASVSTADAVVRDLSLVGKGGFAIAATEGTRSSSQTVATFTDPGGAMAVSNYDAVIDWGDGETSPGVITYDAPGKTFTVSGSHAYDTPGAYDVRTTLRHGNAPDLAVTSRATVADAPITLTAVSASVDEGESFGGVVASFVDADPDSTDEGFEVSIDWGDGTAPTAGTIAADPSVPGRYTIAGTHAYSQGPRSRTFTVTLDDRGRRTLTATGTFTVRNVNPTPTLVAPPVIYAQNAATFTLRAADASSSDRINGFAFSIDWGDGTPVQTVPPTRRNGAGVDVAHAYRKPGKYTVKLTAADRDGGSATTSATVSVAKALKLSGVKINGGGKQRSHIASVAFTMPSPFPALSLAGLSLLRFGKSVSLSGAKLSYSATTGKATLDLRKLRLADGAYELRIRYDDLATLAINFFRLEGDVTGDGKVNSADRAYVQSRLGRAKGQKGYKPDADLDANGKINDRDLKIVKRNLGNRR